MSTFKTKQWVALFLLSLILLPLFLFPIMTSANEGEFGYRVFKLQKKQAIKGSTFAQYKLGTFYEFGISVKPNPNEAKVWYEKAAEKNNKPAANRLIYLEVKKLGYNKSKHLSWVNKIIDESKKANVHSTIILGQLYHNGIAVNKDLDKAIKLLRKASSRGHTEVDNEIAQINKELQKNNPPEEPVETDEVKVKEINVSVKKQTGKQPGKQPRKEAIEVKATEQKAAPKKKSKAKKKKNKSEDDRRRSEEDRRRRYEKAMRKQYREALRNRSSETHRLPRGVEAQSGQYGKSRQHWHA